MPTFSFVTYHGFQVISPTPASGSDAALAWNSNWTAAGDHVINTSNPHSVTAAQVGAYTKAEVDTIAATKEPVITSGAGGTFYRSDKTWAAVAASQVTGLGSAALVSTSAFDAAGAASSVNSSLNAHVSDHTNPHAVTASQVGLGSVLNAAQLVVANNLSDLANAATARANLGLGSAATHPSTDFILATLIGAPNGVAGLDASGNLALPIILYNAQQEVDLAAYDNFLASTPRLGQPYASPDTGIFGVGDGATQIQNLPYKIDSQWGGCIGISFGSTSPTLPTGTIGWLVIGGITTPYVMAQLAAVAAKQGVPAPAANVNTLYLDQNGVDGCSVPLVFNTPTLQYQFMGDTKQNGLRLSGSDSYTVFTANCTGRTNVLTNVSIDLSEFVGSIQSFLCSGFGTTANVIMNCNATTPGAADNTITLQNPINFTATNKTFAIINVNTINGSTLLVDNIRHNNYGTNLFSAQAVSFGQGGIIAGRVVSVNKNTAVSPATAVITMVATNQFSVGETVTQVNSGASGTVVSWTGGTVGQVLVVAITSGMFDSLNVCTGSSTQAAWKPAGIQYIYTMTAGGTGNFAGGETVTQLSTGATGSVQAWDSVNKILTVNPTTGVFDATHGVVGGTSAASWTPSSTQVILDMQGSGTFLAGESVNQTGTSAGGTVVSWDSTNRILTVNVSANTFTSGGGNIVGNTSITIWNPSSVVNTSTTLNPTGTAGVYNFTQLTSAEAVVVQAVPTGGLDPALGVGQEMTHIYTTAADGSVNSITYTSAYKTNVTYPDGSMFLTKLNAWLSAPRTQLSTSGGSGNFQVGETVTQATSGATGVCYSWDSTSHVLVVNVASGTFDASHACSGSTSGASGWTASSSTNIAKKIRVRWVWDISSTPSAWIPERMLLL